MLASVDRLFTAAMQHAPLGVRQKAGSVSDGVNDYHESIVGHGLVITEFHHRVSRIKQHLDLPIPS